MTDTFSHGYALLIGVGECAYPAWSLPATVRDVQALAAALADPDLCAYPEAHLRPWPPFARSDQQEYNPIKWSLFHLKGEAWSLP